MEEVILSTTSFSFGMICAQSLCCKMLLKLLHDVTVFITESIQKKYDTIQRLSGEYRFEDA